MAGRSGLAAARGSQAADRNLRQGIAAALQVGCQRSTSIMAEPWRFEKLKLKSGLKMRIARAGSGPLVVMLHGFPECWYSYRHQIRALSDRFDCVAPEMRGYGETDAPAGVINYTMYELVGDFA